MQRRQRFTGVVRDGRVHDPFVADGPSLAVADPPAEGSWVDVDAAVDPPHLTLRAAPDTALARIWGIAAEEGLDPLHPEDALLEAAAWARDPGIDDPALDDLTDLPLCTIDEQTSRDLDQALSVQADGDGHVVHYAIADAAWFVRPGTALHREALRRGATFYLPGLVVPMLPRVLSEDLVSLNPGEDRRALVFEVRLDRTGRVRSTRILRARVRSRLKTWFSAVQDFLDGATDVPGGDAAVAESLRGLRTVGERRLQVAEERDVVHLRRAEIAVHVGRGGARFVAETDPRNDVERYNEQISLLCNIEGARFLRRGDRDDDEVQPIYRIHDPPTPDRLRSLADTIAGVVKRHRLDPDAWGWRPGARSLAAYLGGLPEGGDEGRIAAAIHRQAILSTGRAGFTGIPGPHHGVGADVYARFTAPMREMVGVFVHKETWEKLGATRTAGDEALREQVIDGAHRARDVQRSLDGKANRLALDQIFHADLARSSTERPERPGTVMGLGRDKIFVRLDDPPIDVKAYLRHLERGGERLKRTPDRLSIVRERDGHVLCRVGDGVRVQVTGHDPERDRWALALR